jgi:hypothetical protein
MRVNEPLCRLPVRPADLEVEVDGHSSPTTGPASTIEF